MVRIMTADDRKREGLTRRAAIGATGAAVLGTTSLLSPNAHAQSDTTVREESAEQVQAPGFYRQRVGDFVATIVSDGAIQWPVANVAGTAPDAQVKALLKANFLDTDSVTSHLNACVIDTGDAKILIDAGAGADYQKGAGKLASNLAAAGIAPDDITMVVLTSASVECVGGLIDSFEQKPRFARAEYKILAREWDYWVNDLDPTAAHSDEEKRAHERVKQTLVPLSARVQRLEGPGEVVPGVRLLASHGRTPGHVSVLVESAGDRLLFAGSALAHAVFAFEQPAWEPAIDVDKKAGAKARAELLEMAASEGLLVLGYHLPYPGLGRVARRGRVYRWVPSIWRWEV